MEIPQNEGFIMENPFNMDDLGVPHFSHLHTARRVDKKKRLGRHIVDVLVGTS